MKNHFVIKNVPTRLPVNNTVLCFFLLHYFKADNLYLGVCITIYAIIWIICIYLKINEIHIDLTSEKEENIVTRQKFREKLDELTKRNN